MVRRHLPDRAGQLGAGHRPRHPAVDGVAAGPLQHRLYEQPVPRPAAVLQMARRRRPAARPDGRAAAAARHRQASPGLHPRGTIEAGAGVRRPELQPNAAIPQSSRCSPRPASGCPSWPACVRDARSDVDLWQREITVRGKGGKDRIVKIGHQAARSLDRYLRARSRHAQAWRPQLWLGAATGSR